MEVEMKIRGLMIDPVTNMPIVILKDMSGNSVLAAQDAREIVRRSIDVVDDPTQKEWLGLRFGIHIMRGIPRRAVAANLPGPLFRLAPSTVQPCSGTGQ